MDAIGIDLGGTNLRAARVVIEASTAKVAAEKRTALPDARDPAVVIRTIADLMTELAPSAAAPVGVGLAGMLDKTGRRVVHAPNIGWRDVAFADLLETELARPVTLVNDLSAITWGETRFGAAQGAADVLCVFIGTGVGAGGVIAQRLFAGGSNVGLEIGHLCVLPQGRRCGCGAEGSLEAYVGGVHLAEMARETASPHLLTLVDGKRDELHAGHLDLAAQQGDPQAQQLIAQAAAFLGGVLGDVTVLFNPDILVLGGTVWQGCPHFRALVVSVFSALGPAPARAHVKLVEADIPDVAGVVGAADLALRAPDAKASAA